MIRQHISKKTSEDGHTVFKMLPPTNSAAHVQQCSLSNTVVAQTHHLLPHLNPD